MIFQVECFAVNPPTDEFKLFECGYATWKDMLALAEKLGWVPAGTKLDPKCLSSYRDSCKKYEREFNLKWFVPDYKPYQWDSIKLVTDEDAMQLAHALKRASQEGVIPFPSPRLFVLNLEATEGENKTVNQMAEPTKISEFIQFLNKGGFGFCFDD